MASVWRGVVSVSPGISLKKNSAFLVGEEIKPMKSGSRRWHVGLISIN